MYSCLSIPVQIFISRITVVSSYFVPKISFIILDIQLARSDTAIKRHTTRNPLSLERHIYLPYFFCSPQTSRFARKTPALGIPNRIQPLKSNTATRSESIFQNRKAWIRDETRASMCFEHTITFDCNHKHIVQTWCKYWEPPLFEAFKLCKTVVTTEYIRHVCPTCALQGLETDSEGDDEVAEAARRRRIWNSFGKSLTFARVEGVGKRAIRFRKTLFRTQRQWRRRWYPLSTREVAMVRQVAVQNPPQVVGRHRRHRQPTRDAWVVPGARSASATNDRLTQGQTRPGNEAGGALQQQRQTPSFVRAMLMPPMEVKCGTRSALDKDELFFEMVAEVTPNAAATRAHHSRDISGGESGTANTRRKPLQIPNASRAGGANPPAQNMPQTVRFRAADSSGKTTTTPSARPPVSKDTIRARAANSHTIPRKPVPRRAAETQRPQIQVRIVVEPKPPCAEGLRRRKGRSNLRADAAKDGLVGDNALLAATITRPPGPRP